MNGRFFAGQQLLADFWDGITNFANGVEGASAKEEDEVICCRVDALLFVTRRPILGRGGEAQSFRRRA